MKRIINPRRLAAVSVSIGALVAVGAGGASADVTTSAVNPDVFVHRETELEYRTRS